MEKPGFQTPVLLTSGPMQALDRQVGIKDTHFTEEKTEAAKGSIIYLKLHMY